MAPLRCGPDLGVLGWDESSSSYPRVKHFEARPESTFKNSFWPFLSQAFFRDKKKAWGCCFKSPVTVDLEVYLLVFMGHVRTTVFSAGDCIETAPYRSRT